MQIALDNLESLITWEKAYKVPALMKAVSVLTSQANAKWYFFQHTGAYRLMWTEDNEGAHFKESHQILPNDMIYAEQLIKDYLIFCANVQWQELKDLGLKGTIFY